MPLSPLLSPRSSSRSGDKLIRWRGLVVLGLLTGLVPLHAGELADPYRWLENNQDPKVQAWVQSQDQRARRFLDGLSQRIAVLNTLKPLIYTDSVSIPR